MTKRYQIAVFVMIIAAVLLVEPALAQTYMSVEPIPNDAVVGTNNLAKIESIGYANLALWSNLLLNQCHNVDSVISVLTENGAVRTITSTNTGYKVGAGGYQAVTDPSYVLTIQDSNAGAASVADIAVLDNALGYVLSQGGDVHFNLNNPKAYDSPLDYAVVSFGNNLSGLQAKAFFDYLGTIDPALWSGTFAGFTQVDNSMVFLKPAATKQEFITGLSRAASTYPWATYETLNNNGQPTTAKAAVSFPGNDWTLFPGGDQYLMNLGNPSQTLLNQLAALRQLHLTAIAYLLQAIDKGDVSNYLNHQFQCPR
jgi:hypothetical protein